MANKFVSISVSGHNANETIAPAHTNVLTSSAIKKIARALKKDTQPCLHPFRLKKVVVKAVKVAKVPKAIRGKEKARRHGDLLAHHLI